MSGLFESVSRITVQRKHLDRAPAGMVRPDPAATAEMPSDVVPEANGSRGTVEAKKALEIEKARSVVVQCPETSRLVAWTDPNSLGAEKFRALAVRLGDMHSQHKLNSMQVTSSVINEGKTFVAANLAVTLAKYSGSKTVLVEGDLHRPTLASMFGLKDLQGISDWWFGPEQDIGRFLVRISGTALWFLPAGRSCDRPSDILHSARFEEAFAELASQFDRIVVDSTPMLPVIDANLWSRLVDGTLLVVREGLAPLKALRDGLRALDRPNLIGVVVNEASEFNQVDYDGQYYGTRNSRDRGLEKIR